MQGIYPREPRNKRKAAKNSTQATTFYYAKDIQYLLHEPLLAKFRDHKALAKKITKALGRNEISDAQRLERNLRPRIALDHIIKERYPTFVDALRDLDDALSMLFLFANLPQTQAVPSRTIALCKRLCLEFEHYLIRSHSLRKSFLSIKGIYYQATIQSQDVLWLVPYKFVQEVSADIDFRVMGTFVDFYTTLLGFVNFRLYTSIGLVYPPVFSAQSDELGGELGAFTVQGRNMQDNHVDAVPALTQDGEATAKAQIEADKIGQDKTADQQPPSSYATATEEQDTKLSAPEALPSAELDTFPESTDKTADVLYQPSMSVETLAVIFEPMTVFLSRETPRHPLELLLRSFGCNRVGWSTLLGDGAYTHDEMDKRITHQIVDRPNLPLPPAPTEGEEEQPVPSNAARVPGRIYIQPQWVWDCINAGKLLRTDLYAPGAVLPPHLSPWVKPTKGEYDPNKPLVDQEMEDEAEAAIEAADDVESQDVDEQEDDDAIAEDEAGLAIGDGMNVALADSDAEESSDEAPEADGAWDGIDESDEEEVDDEVLEARQRQEEVEAEARGLETSLNSNANKKKDNLPKSTIDARKRIAKKQKEDDEEVTRQKMMMSRRKRQLYEKMQYSNQKRDDEASKLRAKRRKLESK